MAADSRRNDSLSGGGYSGRLELTWTNKSKILLAHEEQSYEWVDPADYRVSEVRLLHDITKVGETALDLKRATDNLLIRGDALHALNALAKIPEFAREYVGKVKLVYIDPPFNTGQAFSQYDDALEHSVWLTMMRDRVAQLTELLSPDGTLWVHLDNSEVHRMRCVLDEALGPTAFINQVVWKRTSGKSAAKRGMGTMCDTILVYGRSERARLKPLYAPLSDKHLATEYRHRDERGRYMLGDLAAPGARTGDSGSPWRGRPPGGRNRHWAAPTVVGVNDADALSLPTRQRLDLLDAAGYIYWPDGENSVPKFKRYLTESSGVAMGDLWDDIPRVANSSKERRGFDTQKPEALIERILLMGTEPGDIVLDVFGGSGTTAATAHKLGRRWVISERLAKTVADVTLPRLTEVVTGEDRAGITVRTVPVNDGLPDAITTESVKTAAGVISTLLAENMLTDVDESLVVTLRNLAKNRTEYRWSGGGGFRVLDVGPSMFDEIDGRVYLAEWVTDGALGEAVAAQFGYDYAPDGPFSGAKGKTRLAVVDGLVNEGVVQLLADQLPVGEKMLICGTAIDPECRAVLRELRPGSTMKKVPASILDDYRIRRRDKLALASVLDWDAAEQLMDNELAGANDQPSEVRAK